MAEPPLGSPLKGEGSKTVIDLAVYALLPLVVLGVLLASLIAAGALPLAPSKDGRAAFKALFLGPAGVVISGENDQKLSSRDGRISIAIPAGTVDTPVLLRYQKADPEADPHGNVPLPEGYSRIGPLFDISVEAMEPAAGPIRFQQIMTIEVAIGSHDLELAGRDYSRLTILHLHGRGPVWQRLSTVAEPSSSTVSAKVDGFRLFALAAAEVFPEIVALPQATTPMPPFAETPSPPPTNTAVPAPTRIVTAMQPASPTPLSPTPTVVAPSPVPTPTVPSMVTPIPTPTAVPTVPPTKGIPLHGFRLYINGKPLEAGQTEMQIPNGKIVILTPPGEGGTLPPDSLAKLLVEPSVSRSTVIMAGFLIQSGWSGGVYMNLDKHVSVAILPLLATPTPGPTPAPATATPAPTPTLAPGETPPPTPTPSPTPPPYPAGGRLAFQSDRSGNFEIMLMGSDGSNPVNLTGNPAADTDPSWCGPEKIVFTSDRGWNLDLYSMSSDGSSQLKLTDSPASDWAPACSPDGTKIAFVSERDVNNEIYSMNVDGSGELRLTQSGSADTFPAWSPGGSSITFVSQRDGNREVYVMDSDGSGQTNLTNNAAEDTGPVSRPAGHRSPFIR